MPVTAYEVGDKFIVRTKKRLSTNPDNSWVNSYELEATVAGSTDELLAAALLIQDFEQTIHLSFVEFTQLIISTWEADSVPYDPTAFISSSTSGLGSRNMTSDPLPLNQTWGVTRVAAYGRFGHIFYRGCLMEGMVTSPAGKQIFDDLAATSVLLQGAITSSGMDNLMGGPFAAGLRMVLVNKTGTQVRPLVGFSTGGISAVPQDHAWFNRTTTP